MRQSSLSRDELTGPCRFCSVADPTRVVAYSPNFYVLMSLGPIVEGYALVVARAHIDCVADIPPEQIPEFKQVVMSVRNAQIAIYGTSVCYEHGQSGACLTFASDTLHCHHAHLHIVPSTFRVEEYLRREYGGQEIFGWHQLVSLYNQEPSLYLLSSEDGEQILYSANPASVPRQFFRKGLAAYHRAGDGWDWATHQNWSLIDSGQSRLRDSIKGHMKNAGVLFA